MQDVRKRPSRRVADGTPRTTLQEVQNPLGGEAVSLAYGAFLQNVLNFFFIALAVFCIVKAANTVNKKSEEKPKDPKSTKEEILLTEIRDALRDRH